MFADDTKIYRELANLESDTHALQLDINRLADWAVQWQLRFNPTKCESMRITHNRDKSVPCYTMGSEIKSVRSAKHLGVIICSDLSWSDHVTATANKANKMLGLIYRTTGSSNKEAFTILYKTLGRPILEYATAVWCPYLVKDILALEKI